jgi:hypothetical protein
MMKEEEDQFVEDAEEIEDVIPIQEQHEALVPKSPFKDS